MGEHCFIRPDTDVYFMLACLNEVLSRKVVDVEAVNKTMNGFVE